jgi:hypothetical protein
MFAGLQEDKRAHGEEFHGQMHGCACLEQSPITIDASGRRMLGLAGEILRGSLVFRSE